MSNHMKDWESMNAQSSMTPPARTMQTYRKPKWKEINWKQAELYVNRLQVRIVKAVQADKWRLVKRLQKLITNSFYAKVLAVKRVITNKGKNTPGIDGDISLEQTYSPRKSQSTSSSSSCCVTETAPTGTCDIPTIQPARNTGSVFSMALSTEEII